MRAEKTPDGGMKGILMSVTENDLVPYLVKIDASGKEMSREPLPAPAGRGGGGGGGRAGGGAGAGAAPAGWWCCRPGAWCSASAAAGPVRRRRRRQRDGPHAAATAALGGRAVNPGPHRRCRPSSPRSIRRSLA